MNVDLGILFTRPYWLDEWHAVLVASRPSVAGVWSDLRQGADFAPPLLHLVLWVLRVLSGGELAPAAARALMVAFTLGALVFTFLLLRRRFERVPSWAGALAIATQGMVVAYAFEVRFYAPWLFFAAMLAWTLSLDPGSDRSRRRSWWIAVASVGLCTTHWFGIVTWFLACCGVIVAHRPDRARAVRLLRPTLPGVIAFFLVLPLFLGQRVSVQEKGWVEELSWTQFRELVLSFWGSWLVLVALAAAVIAMTLARKRQLLRDSATRAVRDPSIAALLALALMPVVLTIVSVVQPAMLPRYAITAVLAWAPLIAIAVDLLPRVARAIAVTVVGLAVLLQLGGQLGVLRQVDRVVRTDRLLLQEACRSAEGVAFVTRTQMYYYVAEVRQCPRATFLVLPQEALAHLFFGPNARVQARYRMEGEFARLHERLYGFPRTTTPARLDSLRHFVVMAEPWSLPRDASGREFFSRVVFPNYRPSPLNGNGTLYTREP